MQPVQGHKIQMANLVLGRPLGVLFFLEFPYINNGCALA